MVFLYLLNNYWTTCPEGDDEVRQRYFIRYVYDADDDGFVASEDCDDLNPDTTNDCDGDGIPRELDCNDEDATIDGDCDGDGLVTAEDCDDSDPLLGGDFDDCDGDGVLVDIDCDDSDFYRQYQWIIGKDRRLCRNRLFEYPRKWLFCRKWFVLDSTL